MNYIEKKIEEIINRYVRRGVRDAKKLISTVKNELYAIKSEKDRVKILTAVLEANDIAYQEHLEVCNGNNCSRDQSHEEVTYYLGQELETFGISMDNDSFTRDEKAATNSKLDNILKEMKDLKNGQEVIYNDLVKEIEELKKWYILGKKNWKALYTGKVSEMVAGGIVTDITAKPLIDSFKELPTLLGSLH